MQWTFDQEKLVNHLRGTGFVFPGSEIYGGMANSWDYGPLGANMKTALKNLWTKEFITKSKAAVMIDGSLITNPLVWKASGHLENFKDPLVDCKNCKNRSRADKLLNDPAFSEKTDPKILEQALSDRKIVCPFCKKSDWTSVRSFNLMFKTYVGPLEESSSTVYLRPETAQNIFINFKNIQRTTRMKPPFAVGQIGLAFRNEITPGNFVFRTREFEQMEIEHFCPPGTDKKVFTDYLVQIRSFLIEQAGLKPTALHERKHDAEELAHYSQATTDFEFEFLHGKAELWGLAMRGDYDLKVHQQLSKQDLSYLDDATQQRYLPCVVEPSVGVGRLLYAIWTSAYEEEKLADGETRIVMRFKKRLAPYTLAVLPLVNKLNEQATQVFEQIKQSAEFNVCLDTSGTIGKRYRRQDAIGTPFCATYDFDSINDGCVTVRDRDTMQQVRIKIEQLQEYVSAELAK